MRLFLCDQLSRSRPGTAKIPHRAQRVPPPRNSFLLEAAAYAAEIIFPDRLETGDVSCNDRDLWHYSLTLAGIENYHFVSVHVIHILILYEDEANCAHLGLGSSSFSNLNGVY